MEKEAPTGSDTGREDGVQALAEAVLGAAPVAGLGVLVSFDDGVAPRYVYVNEAAAAMLGRASEALIGSAAQVEFCPKDRRRVEELSARVRRGEILPAATDAELLRPDGECIPVEVAFSSVPLLGAPASVMFLRDIRERKLVEAALRRSEQRFRQLVEAAPDGIGVYEGPRLLYVNPALVTLCGRPFDELVARDMSELVHPSDRDVVPAPRRAAREHVGPQRAEYRILRPDGGVVNVETVSTPIEYEGRSALLGFTRDTTERKLLQAHLALRDRMATLGTLAAGVAHEINNPLAYANLNFEIIVRHLRGLMPQSVVAPVEPMITAARDGLTRVGTIVRDLQSLSAPDSTERWPVDVREVLESAVNVASHAIRPCARVERHYDDVEGIKTDPTKLGQILLNLIFNAVQSFEQPDPSKNVVRLSVTKCSRGDLIISVADNGSGIAKEHLPRIFEPFFTTKTQGMGLGLTICQALAASLRGKLTVESEIGQGTTFILQLPGPAQPSPRGLGGG